MCILEWYIWNKESQIRFLYNTNKEKLSAFVMIPLNRIYNYIPTLFSSLLFIVTSTKVFCNVNTLYGNLKSENSQDYAQKPQRNRTSMNSASVQIFHSLLAYIM